MCPNFSLTTGTFNLIVKDRIAFRLSGAPSVQANSHECEFDCPRNLVKLSSRCSPVNSLCSQDFHLFYTARSSTSAAKAGRSLDWSAPTEVVPFPNLATIAIIATYRVKRPCRLQLLGSSVYAQQNASSAQQGPMPNRQQAAAEEDSFEKRSLGGSCDNAKTLRGTLSPNAGLVAETNFRY